MRKIRNERAGNDGLKRNNSRAYEYLGAHRAGESTVFRVWAPNALSVFLVGDFNLWDESCEMKRIGGGVFEASVASDAITNGTRYKFRIVTEKGELYRSDPFARMIESNSELSSLFFESAYEWRDGGWLEYRKAFAAEKYSRPMNVYELHLGSWRWRGDGSRMSYLELARELSRYAKKMGYTHIQLLPVTDHVGSPTEDRRAIGLFAPTAAHGSPDELRKFVDHMHRSGIGVIFDLGSLALGKCTAGLARFDGTELYETSDATGVHFDLKKEEVREYLTSNVLFFADEFHADGLFLGSVSAMLYPDAERESSRPNVYGSVRSPEAVSFFRELNKRLKQEHPDVITVAKESAAWSNVTGTENGGLGFDFKWNMGWAADTLNYAGTDPYFRSGNHDRLTFPPVYSFAEKYILPISHGALCGDQPSLISRMPGEYKNKFAGVRLFEAYKLCFPGKKLCFAGTELGQFDPFDPKRETQWFLLGYDMHARLSHYFAELGHFYLSRPELWEKDASPEGFRFICSDRKDISVIAFERTGGGKRLFAAFNFTPVHRHAFALEMPSGGMYREVFNSDRNEFGGGGAVNPSRIRATEEKGKHYIRMILPPLGCAIFEKI